MRWSMRKTFALAIGERLHHVREDVLAIVLGREGRAGADRVIDREANASRGHLRVMDERRRQPVRPGDLRARHEMLFHVVGVHFDGAGRDVVAAGIDRAGQGQVPWSRQPK